MSQGYLRDAARADVLSTIKNDADEGVLIDPSYASIDVPQVVREGMIQHEEGIEFQLQKEAPLMDAIALARVYGVVARLMEKRDELYASIRWAEKMNRKDDTSFDPSELKADLDYIFGEGS